MSCLDDTGCVKWSEAQAALLKAAHGDPRDHGDAHEAFPAACPWTLEELLDHAFWPR
jgi:hypothetical protein